MRPSGINRRQFLGKTLAAGAALGVAPLPCGAADVTGQPAAGKIGDFKISLAKWSLHRVLFAKDAPITNLDFPRVAREQFGIDGVEFVNQFFPDKAHDSAYLKDLKQRADDLGVACVLIMVDREGDLSAPDKAARMQAVEGHKKGVDADAALGCHSIRINTGSHYSPTDVAAAAEACAALTEYAERHRLNVICENHGGPSSDPDALLALIRAVGKDRFGTLPDFGNFPTASGQKDGSYTIDIYAAIARMMPYAKGVSAKSYDFGPDGKETVLDYARLMKIVTDADDHGYVGIEYEGNRLSEPEGIRATRSLLETLRGSIYRP